MKTLWHRNRFTLIALVIWIMIVGTVMLWWIIQEPEEVSAQVVAGFGAVAGLLTYATNVVKSMFNLRDNDD